MGTYPPPETLKTRNLLYILLDNLRPSPAQSFTPVCLGIFVLFSSCHNVPTCTLLASMYTHIIGYILDTLLAVNSIHLSTHTSTHPSVCTVIYLSTCPNPHLSTHSSFTHLSIYISILLPTHPPIYPSTHQACQPLAYLMCTNLIHAFIHPSIYLSARLSL